MIYDEIVSWVNTAIKDAEKRRYSRALVSRLEDAVLPLEMLAAEAATEKETFDGRGTS